MKKPKEETKNCDCKEPKLVGGICQSMQGHFFQFCSKCRRERKIFLDVDKLTEGL
jgi:hypothetical protein